MTGNVTDELGPDLGADLIERTVPDLMIAVDDLGLGQGETTLLSEDMIGVVLTVLFRL